MIKSGTEEREGIPLLHGLGLLCTGSSSQPARSPVEWGLLWESRHPCYLTINRFPVISFGISRPRSESTVGATS